jgi:hypothetical protein
MIFLALSTDMWCTPQHCDLRGQTLKMIVEFDQKLIRKLIRTQERHAALLIY